MNLSRLGKLCLSIAVLLGSAGMSWSAEPKKGLCLHPGVWLAKPLESRSHAAISGQCSDAYENGNYTTALREWKTLAEQGSAPAQFNLGNMYRRGQGVPQDDETAVKWYRLAAEQGNPFGQNSLGQMYRN